MFWILCGIMLISISFFIEEDEKRLQEILKEDFLKNKKTGCLNTSNNNYKEIRNNNINF